jgi:hypothetical protein
LLTYRAERYAALAEICVPFEQHKTKGISWSELMSAA